LKHRSFRAIALDSSFGKQLWHAVRSNFQEQLIALKNSIFRGQLYKQLRGAAFSSNFREQLSGAALQNSFGDPFWCIGLKHRSFRAIALDSSFGKQLCPEQLSGTIDCFEEQHLSGTALQTTSGSSFQ